MKNRYVIADLVLEIDGDSRYIADDFEAFRTNSELPPDMAVEITEEHLPPIPFEEDDEKWKHLGLFRICYDGNRIYQRFLSQGCAHPRIAVIEGHFHKVIYYMDRDWMNEYGSDRYEQYLTDVRLNMKGYLQEAFFNMVLSKGAISIHSASVVYKGKAILFSAPSQTGKSTQANMWHRLLGTEILDGDATVCRVIGGKPYVYGLPWAGSSGVFINRRVELDAIIYLKQGEVNILQSVTNPIEQFQRLFAASFSETWDQEMLDRRTKATEQIMMQIRSFFYRSRKDESAVYLLKEALDAE